MERNKSALYVFLASVCFSTGGLFIKLIPWSALAINGARNLIGAAVIGIYLLFTGHRLVFSRRVLIGALSMMEPILNPLLVAAFYGERITALSVAGCVIVVCTVLMYNVWLAKRKQPEG